jgi:tetratricopeptide (TPR) repeat protein
MLTSQLSRPAFDDRKLRYQRFQFPQRGDAYYELGDYEKAIADYTEAIHLDPKYVESYKGRGNAYQALGKQSEAEVDFQKYKEISGQP